MLGEVTRNGCLHQRTAVLEIADQFGEEFINTNVHGTLSIARKVLLAFKKLTGNDVVWEVGKKLWRKREPRDGPGRLQV